MIDRTHALPLTRQAEVLKLSRSSVYYQPRPVSPADLSVMRRIDALHLDHPFAGSRMLRDLLAGEGVEIGRQRVATMMKRMGIEAIYRRPNTSKPGPGHKLYPYLLRNLAVHRPEQLVLFGKAEARRSEQARSTSARTSSITLWSSIQRTLSGG